MGQKFTSFAKIKKGQKIRVIKTRKTNGQSHEQYPINKILIARKGGSGYSKYIYDLIEGYNQILYASDCELVQESISEMKLELERIKSERGKELNLINKKYDSIEKNLESKIKFCTEAGIEEYDEDTFKVYKTLAVLKESKTDVEKAKVIAALIKK